MNTTFQDIWVDRQNIIYRKNNLVFALTEKNAGTWAKNLLTHNGFVTQTPSNIDWHRDHVFGFIQDPFRRRIKGIVEDLITFYSVEQYLLNNLGHKFWTDHLVFGPHSIPLSLTWHDKMYLIDWIPIDQPEIDLNRILQKLFDYHQLTIEFLSESENPSHKSFAYKNELFDRIKHIIGEGSGNLYLMLAKDIDLYNSVNTHFHKNHSEWHGISWLQNFNRT